MVLLLGVCALGIARAQSKGGPDAGVGGATPAPPEAPKVSPDTPVANATVGSPGVDPNTFVIGPGDALYIEVFRQPNFSRAVGVRPDGKITMPINLELQAAGLTPNKLSEQIKEALSDQIVNPLVTVTVTQVNSKKYTISGEIGRPGMYPLTEPIHVFDALNNAGGFRDFANKKRIVIVRGSQRLYFNYQDFLKSGKNPEKNVLVENGDTIVVN